MIKSMTGYGKAELSTGTGRVVVEIRSVNHRYGEMTIKMPRTWLALENEVKKCVSARIKRGKVDVFIQRETGGGGANLPQVNLPLARAYLAALLKLKEDLGLDEPVTLAQVIAQKDVLASGEAEVEAEELQEELMSVVSAAVDSLEAMRAREGEALLSDIRQRRELLASLIERIAARAPQVPAEYAVRLQERIAQLLRETAVDEGRLAQEVALMADRSDVTEELVRFRSHLGQLDAALRLGEPVGRKLDFLLQELNREANTIGSKANDAEVAAAVVALKAELEKIREQVQNIE
jgi:uncharacterized protein (TIGR00255 family)